MSTQTITLVSQTTPQQITILGQTLEPSLIQPLIPFIAVKGKEATVTVGEVTTGQPNTPVIITNTGTDNDAILNFTIPSGDKYHRHTQNIPLDTWVITHNMGKKPSVFITDSAGTVVEGLVTYTDNNTITVSFSAGFSGYAELN